MSLAALATLIRTAQMFEPYSARLRRRNAILADLYAALPGEHWTRLSILAGAIVSLRPRWRRYRYSDRLPGDCDEVERAIFMASKILDKLPPATAHGLNQALKSAESHISISRIGKA